MIWRVFSAALLAGFLAACVASGLQALWTTPLIVESEVLERRAAAGAPSPTGLASAHLTAEHAGPHETVLEHGWRPADGLQRAALTSLATLISAVGYALVLLALLLGTGATPTLETSLRWSLGAFLAVNLAPAIGLPPELPGMGGGDPAPRQAWWILTVAATALGLYLVVKVRSLPAVVAGALALAAPHVVGAPHGAAGGDVPASLAAQFATRSLAVAFVFWATLGLGLSWAWSRQDRPRSVAAAR